ncbi:uncharacterized protein [Eschrichtius robustus]|uniref:uncharacterized protein n=1 Tax=Eschrichtius robustus TaxID=9764 RepID=UPI0035BFFBA3
MLWWRPRLSGSKTSDVRRCLCGNQRGAGKDGGGVGWVWGQRPVLRGSALLDLAHPVEQPKPRLQPRTVFAARVPLVAGPALTVSELAAALWPNRWLALLRRLTVLPFEGLLYLARLGAAATGCRGWQLDVGPRGHVARARHHVPRALTHRSLGALVRGRAVRTHLHPVFLDFHRDLEYVQRIMKRPHHQPRACSFLSKFLNQGSNPSPPALEAQSLNHWTARAIGHFLDLFHPDTRNEQLHRPGVQEIRSNLQNKFAFCSLSLSTKRTLIYYLCLFQFLHTKKLVESREAEPGIWRANCS